MSDDLLQTLVGYLEERGWYFDWEHVNEVWGEEEDEREPGDELPLKRPDAIRVLPGWTVPQWGAYWHKPYDDEPGHANFGAPAERRYENLKDALWAQLLREEEPQHYEMFFKVKEAK